MSTNKRPSFRISRNGCGQFRVEGNIADYPKWVPVSKYLLRQDDNKTVIVPYEKTVFGTIEEAQSFLSAVLEHNRQYEAATTWTPVEEWTRR